MSVEPRPVRGVTIDALNSKPKPECRHILQNITKIVDELIMTAHNVDGRGCVSYDLNTTYDIPGMNHKDAAIYICSELVLIYQAKGFKPSLTPMASKTVFTVRWETSLPRAERERREKIIESVRTKSEFESLHTTRGRVFF